MARRLSPRLLGFVLLNRLRVQQPHYVVFARVLDHPPILVRSDLLADVVQNRLAQLGRQLFFAQFQVFLDLIQLVSVVLVGLPEIEALAVITDNAHSVLPIAAVSERA